MGRETTPDSSIPGEGLFSFDWFNYVKKTKPLSSTYLTFSTWSMPCPLSTPPPPNDQNITMSSPSPSPGAGCRSESSQWALPLMTKDKTHIHTHSTSPPSSCLM
ncbi:hypothetical protein E2C01_001552 [Portunus trituberculatus]|uniref:Uncharacterized protein n=1 Tax=Portunus trituberculatus TaxID=210409 RepID=A0A5B7CJP9_PORTR|nr:hypothetical protein [Portunus trituberculatus]